MVTSLSLVSGDGLMGRVCMCLQVTKLIPLETTAWITVRANKGKGRHYVNLLCSE